MSNFSRGSEWRKWDFHVHTPASVLNNQFGDDWDQYVQILFRKAIEKNIAAIGITDYFSIEGYKKIREEYLANIEKLEQLFNTEEIEKINNILVFPNIEFRLKKFVGSSAINYHVIFSDKVNISDIENNFLHLLTFVYSEHPETGAETRPLTKENLILFGEKLQAEHANFRHDSSPLFTGTNNVKIDDLDLVKVLKSKNSLFENKYFFVIPSDEDLSTLSWNGQDHNDRKLLIQKSHFLLSGNPNTEKWGLGEFNTDQEEYINEFKSLKPTLWGSDAHDFEKLFEPDLKRYTWIKADPTFEGLRQVIYEQDRVKISEFVPSTKNSYQVIKNVKLIDSGELFGNQVIGFNQDLNSIIGGKSSGKSLLLYHIAKSVMNHEKFHKISSTEGFQKYDDLPAFELEVTWGDGFISKLSDIENKRPIVYIPQMYLNYMAEKKNRNEDFKQTIDGILKTNVGYDEFISTKQNEILDIEQRIDNVIRNYFKQLETYHNLQRELVQLGDRNAIVINIGIIEHQLNTLKNTAGFTQPELDRYTALNESNKVLLDRNHYLVSLKKLYDDLEQNTIQIDTKILSYIQDEFSDIKYKYQNEDFKEIIERVISSLSTSISSGIGSYISSGPFDQREIDAEITSNEQQIVENNKLIQPLNEKAKNLESLKKQQNALDLEKAKILAIDHKISEVESQKGRINFDNIIDLYSSLLECYRNIIVKHEEYKHISESIDLVSEISFNVENFRRDFSDYITKNRTLETMFNGHGFEGNQFSYSEENHIENIHYVCNTILSDVGASISFNQSKQKQEIISALFKNYFDISYDLMQGTDRLAHMSPGKKGIILFQLFLHMSSSQDPILIDQPEDNLDNRTVYQELNDFIKEKKLQRQIIIVSHNSNLVVSTDSENVIVAHQNANSESSPKFVYVNGSLENTFIDPSSDHILKKQGIREHVCEILEGGVDAFKKREKKYNI